MTEFAEMVFASRDWPKAILFDLDGTLIDSAADIAAAINEVLAQDGLTVQSVDAVRGMIGNGVRKLVERAYAASGLPIYGDRLDQATERMMAIYGQHLTRHTTLLTGAREMITAYHGAGVKIAVVTNKPENLTSAILAYFGLDGHVDVVVGGDTGPAKKPAPDMLLFALKALGLSAAHALMVGDSPADIDAAKAASMASIAVHGGYSSKPADALGADGVITSLLELPSAIEALDVPALPVP